MRSSSGALTGCGLARNATLPKRPQEGLSRQRRALILPNRQHEGLSRQRRALILPFRRLTAEWPHSELSTVHESLGGSATGHPTAG
jgi:hypothetical protein